MWVKNSLVWLYVNVYCVCVCMFSKRHGNFLQGITYARTWTQCTQKREEFKLLKMNSKLVDDISKGKYSKGIGLRRELEIKIQKGGRKRLLKCHWICASSPLPPLSSSGLIWFENGNPLAPASWVPGLWKYIILPGSVIIPIDIAVHKASPGTTGNQYIPFLWSLQFTGRQHWEVVFWIPTTEIKASEEMNLRAKARSWWE